MTSPRFRFDPTAPIPSVADLGAVHILAIGGAGMSAVARLALEGGLRVAGSDAADSALLARLRAEGARVTVGHDPAQVDGADTVVVSSAIRVDNAELVRARALGLRVLHRSQALAAFMSDATRLAVAGANGKTTTSSMLTLALRGAGLDPGFAIGAEVPELGSNAGLGSGPFVVEADESDGTFVVYRPHVAVVTNVQPDHLDYYGSFAAVQDAYAAFARTLSPGGLLVACADDEGSAALARRVADEVRVLTYGESADADVRLLPRESCGLRSAAQLRDPHGHVHELRLRVPGAHNLANAAAAWTAAVEGVGASSAQVLAALADFGGARRRFEVAGEVGGVLVVDDYAHNPGKVAAVVGTAAAIAGERGGALRVLFQPHLYSRTADFADQFAAALAPATDVVLLDIYGAREAPVPGVTSEVVLAAMAPRGEGSPQPRVLSRQQAVDQLAALARPGDVLLTVGAGDVTHCAAALVQALEAR